MCWLEHKDEIGGFFLLLCFLCFYLCLFLFSCLVLSSSALTFLSLAVLQHTYHTQMSHSPVIQTICRPRAPCCCTNIVVYFIWVVLFTGTQTLSLSLSRSVSIHPSLVVQLFPLLVDTGSSGSAPIAHVFIWLPQSALWWDYEIVIYILSHLNRKEIDLM